MIADAHHALVQDYTGLTSGHQRPAKVEQAYDAMIEAWADYNFACDASIYTPEQLMEIRNHAREIDAEYHRLYTVWQTAQGECKCRMIDADRDYTCMAHRAQAELNGAGDMPF